MALGRDKLAEQEEPAPVPPTQRTENAMAKKAVARDILPVWKATVKKLADEGDIPFREVLTWAAADTSIKIDQMPASAEEKNAARKVIGDLTAMSKDMLVKPDGSNGRGLAVSAFVDQASAKVLAQYENDAPKPTAKAEPEPTPH